MSQEEKQSDSNQIFNSEQLKRFVALMSQSTEEQNAFHKNQWDAILAEVRQNLDKDPKSMIGKQLAKQWVDFVENYYGDEYRDLYETAWNAHKAGKIEPNDAHYLSPEFIHWIEKALANYKP